MSGEGTKFDGGKLRYDLLQKDAIRGLAEVLTFGASKYSDRNWEKGMQWSRIIASLKRHLSAIENGEDYDKESGLLHVNHLQCNAHFLSAYYNLYPQGDDRPHKYLSIPKIGLDIDDVIADFTGAFGKKFGFPEPENWRFTYNLKECFKEICATKDFYVNLPVKINPADIPFEPHCYITSRSIPVEWTQEWLEKNNFSCKPVYCVPFEESKLDIAKKSGIDIFVDDKFTAFAELNNAGICTYLFDNPHNRRYDVGYKRIYDLKTLY